MKRVLIFTDLDGTLLDSSYSFHEALPALDLTRERGIPLIICSSKTRTEIEHYRERLDNKHPFISENGGGIFLPEGYFDLEPEIVERYVVTTEEGYDMLRLGARYGDLRRALGKLRDKGFSVRGFGDMTVEEVAALTGLSPGEAGMAKKRDFDEPFVIDDNEGMTDELFSEIREMGFHFTRGAFHHILGNSDKGRAVEIVIKLYQNALGDVKSIALGDSPNDFPMLAKVDVPVLVQRTDGRHIQGHNIPNVILQEGIGPVGWGRAVLRILSGVT